MPAQSVCECVRAAACLGEDLSSAGARGAAADDSDADRAVERHGRAAGTRGGCRGGARADEEAVSGGRKGGQHVDSVLGRSA